MTAVESHDDGAVHRRKTREGSLALLAADVAVRFGRHSAAFSPRSTAGARSARGSQPVVTTETRDPMQTFDLIVGPSFSSNTWHE